MLPSKIKRIVNTRNPFSRLYAAWGDKLRLKRLKQERWEERYGDFWDNAEEPGFKVPNGYRNSFHAFLRYVTQEEGEHHLNRLVRPQKSQFCIYYWCKSITLANQLF